MRKDYLRASQFMKAKVAHTENIEVLYNCNATGLFGEGVVQGMDVVRFAGLPEEEHFKLPIDGFFLAIGHKPNTELFGDCVELDAKGFVKTHPNSQATNLPGVLLPAMSATRNISKPSQRRHQAAGRLSTPSVSCSRTLFPDSLR